MKGKLDEIKVYSKCYLPDLICISETKISDTFYDNELLGDNFTIYRNDRKDGGGGVLIAARNMPELRISNSNKGPGESITITVCYSNLKINLVAFYRPPSESCLDNLKAVLEHSYNAQTVVIGDLNFPDIDWAVPPHNGVIKASSSRKSLHKNALEIFRHNNLTQLVHESTHRLGNTLDLVLFDQNLLENREVKTTVMPRLSDHNMILVDITTHNTKKMTEAPPKLKYNFKRAKFPDIKLKFENLSTSLKGKNANEMWCSFKSTIQQALAEDVPTLLSKPKGHPWMTRDLLRTIRQRDDRYADAKADGIIDDAIEKELAKKVKKDVRKAKSQFLNGHVGESLSNGNTKPLFSYISKHKGKSNQISSIKNAETADIPDSLADFFSSVFVSGNDVDISRHDSNNTKKIRMSHSGLKSLLKTVDVRKASGPDGISGYTISQLAENVDEFTDCLYMVYEASLKQHTVPEDWRTANVVPIFKAGSRAEPGNYRPISLTSILGKLLEHIIASQMWDHIEEKDIITTKQHGFRKRLSTTTQLLHVVHNAGESINDKLNYNMVSFDFTKAFDKVCHNMLINKLYDYNFPTEIILWIQQWLTGRSSVVMVNSGVSKSFEVTSGVPQGSVLGPLLFLLFIDDLTQNIKSDIRLYADDALLCKNIQSDDDALAFQQDIHNMYEWSRRNRMMFNISKCVHMELNHETPQYHFCLNGQVIPQGTSIKYLGVTIDHKLKFSEHIGNIVKKGNQLLGMLTRCLNYANDKTKLVAFNAIVRPTVEYASQVWSPQAKNRIIAIDRVQRKGIRWIYHLDKLDSVSECMIAHDVISLFDRRNALDLQLINKIQLGDYDIDIRDYIHFNTTHNTRGNTINPQFNSNIFKDTFFNRMRPAVKITH